MLLSSPVAALHINQAQLLAFELAIVDLAKTSEMFLVKILFIFQWIYATFEFVVV